MVYQGSKNRLAKFIIPILQKYIDENFEDLSSFQINGIICGARESLENKLSILSELKDKEKSFYLQGQKNSRYCC